MRTQCPHCKAKFKARDESVGKKAKCPKCGQSFTMTMLTEGRIQKLLVDDKGSTDKRTSEVAKQTGWLSFKEASRVGIIISIVGMFIVINCCIIWVAKETKTRKLTIPASYKFDNRGIPYEDREKQAVWVKPQLSMSSMWALLLPLGPAVGAILSLLLRSFRPRLVIWRGILTILGGSMVGSAVITISFHFIELGSISLRWLLIQILILLLGFMLLRIGFRAKESRS